MNEDARVLNPCPVCGSKDGVEIIDASSFASVWACSECGSLRIPTPSNTKD